MLLLLLFYSEYQNHEKGKKSQASWHHILSCLMVWLTNHTHIRISIENPPAVLRSCEEKLHSLWHHVHIYFAVVVVPFFGKKGRKKTNKQKDDDEREESRTLSFWDTFPNWPLWIHIHWKSLSAFFLVVKVKLSHISYCSTFFKYNTKNSSLTQQHQQQHKDIILVIGSESFQTTGISLSTLL